MDKLNNILNGVIEALTARRGEWESIAKDAEVSYSWLSKLANKKIPNPGIKSIGRLHDALGLSKKVKK